MKIEFKNQKKLMKQFDCSLPTIISALQFKTNSHLSNEIRKFAVNHGGVLYHERADALMFDFGLPSRELLGFILRYSISVIIYCKNDFHVVKLKEVLPLHGTDDYVGKIMNPIGTRAPKKSTIEKDEILGIFTDTSDGRFFYLAGLLSLPIDCSNPNFQEKREELLKQILNF